MRTHIRVNGEEAVALESVKQSGRNTVEIADALLGLSLAIGLLIDDAVVVRENIFKHLERASRRTTRRSTERRRSSSRCSRRRSRSSPHRQIAGELRKKVAEIKLPSKTSIEYDGGLSR
jgi:hypothetical protein